MLLFKPVVDIPSGPPRPVAARTVRKLALCGSHSSSLQDAPWDDPTWEFWGHAASRAYYQRPMDVYFDLHPKACWQKNGKKFYTKFLAANTVPIYMQRAWPEVPASRKYPRGRILTLFSYAHQRHYFTNQVSWMIALAISEGATHIGLFGINYSAESEYAKQRGSAEYWLGQLDGRGITVYLPRQCSLLAEPKELYGYESHDEKTGVLKEAYKVKPTEKTPVPLKPGQPAPPLVTPTAEIQALIEAEERDYPRPEWAMRPLQERSDGHAQA